MKDASPWIATMVVAVSSSCHCERAIDEDADTEAITSTSGTSAAPPATSTTTTESSTGTPFDASRWLGRYHYETVGLEFGERGEPLGSYMLANFEISSDGTASLFYDECAFDVPITIAYEWLPDEPGWLELHPGAGESSLRMLAAENLESLRIHLVEPCRELEFEIDGNVSSWLPFHPGESCWIERCVVANTMHVDYCPGEEPPPCP